MRAAAVIRGAFHRARTVAPQRPLERPAPDFVCIATWPPRSRRSTPFRPRRPFRVFESQAPVHAPRCQREARFSEPRRCLPTSATFFDARAHPSSVRPSHASGAFAPLLAGTNRCRLRWPPRCVAEPGTCEPRSACAGFRASHSTCVDESDHGPRHPSKGGRAVLTSRACPPRSTSSTRVTGSIRREVWSPSRLVVPA